MCDSVYALRTTRAFATPPKSLMPCSKSRTRRPAHVVSLQRRWLWRARRWLAVRRHRHRPALAAAYRRAGTLRARRGPRGSRILPTMEAFSNESELIPEQVWDTPDIAKRNLHFGRPSGSAMPLVWLVLSSRGRSLHAWPALRPAAANGATLSEEEDRIPAPDLADKPTRRKSLCIELMAPGVIHWTADEDLARPEDSRCRARNPYGRPSHPLSARRYFKFTFYWPDACHWKATTSWLPLLRGAGKTLSHGKGMGQMEGRAKSEVGIVISPWRLPLSCFWLRYGCHFPGLSCSSRISSPSLSHPHGVNCLVSFVLNGCCCRRDYRLPH